MEKHKEVPNHIGIIMDGNRRWAKRKHLPPQAGHWEGVKRLEELGKYCKTLDVDYLTVYAFSTENWKRDRKEVETLMKIFFHYIQVLLKDDDKDVRIKVYGDISQFSSKLQKGIHDVEEKTKNYSKLTLGLCLNYSGRSELLQAVKKVASEVKESNKEIDDITLEDIQHHFYTKDIPDPDLIIRTSGELRLSDFLTFQSSYAELYFTDLYWPDFKNEELDKAIEEYGNRQRRYGGN